MPRVATRERRSTPSAEQESIKRRTKKSTRTRAHAHPTPIRPHGGCSNTIRAVLAHTPADAATTRGGTRRHARTMRQHNTTAQCRAPAPRPNASEAVRCMRLDRTSLPVRTSAYETSSIIFSCKCEQWRLPRITYLKHHREQTKKKKKKKMTRSAGHGGPQQYDGGTRRGRTTVGVSHRPPHGTRTHTCVRARRARTSAGTQLAPRKSRWMGERTIAGTARRESPPSASCPRSIPASADASAASAASAAASAAACHRHALGRSVVLDVGELLQHLREGARARRAADRGSETGASCVSTCVGRGAGTRGACGSARAVVAALSRRFPARVACAALARRVGHAFARARVAGTPLFSVALYFLSCSRPRVGWGSAVRARKLLFVAIFKKSSGPNPLSPIAARTPGGP